MALELLFASSLARYKTSNFFEARDYVDCLSKPFEVARPTRHFPLSFTHSSIQVNHIRFDYMNLICSREFQIIGAGIDDQYIVQIPLSGSCKVEQGEQQYLATAGSVFVINPFTPSLKQWSGSVQQLRMWIDRRTIEAVLQDELGYEIDHPLIFDTLDISRPTPNEELSNCILNITKNIDLFTQPDDNWRSKRQLERWLIVKILTSLPHNYSHEIKQTENQVAPYYVRRVEKFFEDNLSEQITMADIYSVAGVSERTLFYGYRQFRKTTPMAQLKKTRLEKARTMLQKMAKTGGSVTHVAMNCGFSHPGIFAREYKRRFGETPSQTLRTGTSLSAERNA